MNPRRWLHKGWIALILAALALLMSPAAPNARAAIVVRPQSHTTHGTLVNRHIVRVKAPIKPVGVKRAVHTAKPTIRRHVTRARRHAKVHHSRHRSGGVMGHVYNASGEPVSDAHVAVARSGHAKRSHNRHLHAARSTVTDNTGHFVLRGIAAGGHRLVASKSGAGKASKTVHIKGGATRSGVQMKLASAHHKHKKHHHHKKA